MVAAVTVIKVVVHRLIVAAVIFKNINNRNCVVNNITSGKTLAPIGGGGSVYKLLLAC